MVERLIDHVTKVTTFGTITIKVFSFIVVGFNGLVEKVFCLFDLISNPGQICQPKRGAVFVNKVFEGKIVKCQVIISEIKTILWKKVGLVYKLKVVVLHSTVSVS